MSFDKFTGFPLAATDLENSTGLPRITDEVKRISLLSKTERQVEFALKQAAYAEAVRHFNLTFKPPANNAQRQSGALTADDSILMTVSVTILHAIMGADKTCPHGSGCKVSGVVDAHACLLWNADWRIQDWWFYLADFFHRAAKEAAAQDALMISRRSVEEAASSMELMGWGALDQEDAKEQSLEAKLGWMKI